MNISLTDSLAQLQEHLNTDSAQIRSVLVHHNNELLLEEYYNGFSAQDPQILYSCTKSITGLIAGIALEQEGWHLLQMPLCQFFPDFDFGSDERKSKMTLEHVLTMTSGIKWQEAGRPWAVGNTNYEMEHSENWLQFVLNLPSTSEGGQRFSYATGISHLILAIVERMTQTDPIEFAKKNFFDLLHIEHSWDTDPQGLPQGGKGLRIRPSDLLKIGLCVQNKGIYEGKQVIPAYWIEQSLQVRSRGHMYYGQYGYHWWIKEGGVFAAIGYGGQFLYMVPELNLTCVFTGYMVGAENFELPQQLFREYILKPLQS